MLPRGHVLDLTTIKRLSCNIGRSTLEITLDPDVLVKGLAISRGEGEKGDTSSQSWYSHSIMIDSHQTSILAAPAHRISPP